MLVKDILKSAAIFLGKDNVVSYIDSSFRTGSNDAKSNCSSLLTVLNMVIDEIASNYIPLYFEDGVSPSNRRAYIDSFDYVPVKIIDVFDTNHKHLEYEVYPTYLVLPNEARWVKYSYVPHGLGNTDSIGYSEEDIPQHVIVYGVLSEYCIYENRFSEAIMWNEKFTKGLEKCLNKLEKENRRNRRIKGRRFI